jgi:hypothetical protein
MFQRFKLAVVATAAFGAACSSDAPTSINADGTRASLQSPTPEAVPIAFSILPSAVVGGDAGTPSGTVSVDSAVTFDRILQVRSNNSTVLPYLGNATIVPAYSTRANVQLIPSAVSAPTVVRVFVTGGGVTVSADLTVNPPGTPPPPPTLASFTVSPNTVNAGATATGTITAPSAAPTGGLKVAVFSRLPGTARVPDTVTIAAGSTSVSFPITTFAGFPNSTTSALLTATNGDSFVASSINVVTGDGGGSGGIPALGAPTLLTPTSSQQFRSGTNITFDWSDVSGAASYTIQIDDRDSFPSPLIVNQTVTASRFSKSNLPRTTMWWRVRANSASGVAGQWSSVRRFEVK